ncbi:unnamed protein product [Rotaria magnacalcarata]|uniref:Uncharacterized protein n=1 Tax=Rotaria magnacalcarata TaxID=392030 RepID=A0A816RS60_9BILA|nr:unnamed protein product [Rotaria magnacalcarata]CAF4176210.1 unnamed protein product [Rotaria magnacalcarata]
MASYDLGILCHHEINILSIYPYMSYYDIMQLVASNFNIKMNSFELQVYDEQFQSYVDFDEECAQRLRQVLPRTEKKTLPAEVLFQEISEAEPEFSSFQSVLSPSCISANSPNDMSVSEDSRSMTPTLDMKLCFHDAFPSSSNDIHSNSSDDANATSRIVFVRDVSPYQRNQYHVSDRHQDATFMYTKKKKYITRLQGVKSDRDNKYASVLPEIKLPSHVLRQDEIILVIAAVVEQHHEKQVIWNLDAQKGFLRDDLETDTTSYNLIRFKIDRSTLINDGILKLPLRLCTTYQNQVMKDSLVFHTLGISDAQKLHSAKYIPNATRLACVIADRNGTIQWDTFGLSEFMHPKPCNKRKADKLDHITTNFADQTEKEPKMQHTATTTFMTNISNLLENHICSIHNFIIAWFDTNLIDRLDLISEVHQAVKSVITFDKQDTFLDFLTDTHNQEIVVILPSCSLKTLMPIIHNMCQVTSIYVYCTHNNKSKNHIKKWRKVIGVFNDIIEIFDKLKQIVQEPKHNVISKSVASVTSNSALIKSNPSFMYTQLLKEILLQFKYSEMIKRDFVNSIRNGLTNNDAISHVVNEFEHEHTSSSDILWYTKESFVYSLLNQALRTKDYDTVFKMRYAIRDLHNRFNRLQPWANYNNPSQIHETFTEPSNGLFDRPMEKSKGYQITSNHLEIEASCMYDFFQQIERLHLNTDQAAHATLYRGQALSKWELEKLKQNIGGVVAFNSFLSTSMDSKVSNFFAQSAQYNPDSVGILFQITIHITPSYQSFILLDNIKNFDFPEEKEVLILPYTNFRVAEMTCVADRLWHVNLISSDDCNKQFESHPEKRRTNVNKESAKLHDLFSLMITMGEYEKAEQLYRTLQETENDDNREEFAYLCKQLGCIKNSEHDFNSAFFYYQKALENRNNNLSNNDLELAGLFNNIGMVHKSLREYSSGVVYLRKALDIQKQFQTYVHPDLAISYNNLGLIYSATGEFTKALSFFQKAIEIQQKLQVSPDPILALVYINVAQVHCLLEGTSTALIYLEKALDILLQKSMFTSIELVEVYNKIGAVHEAMRNNTAALSNYEKALQIQGIYYPSIEFDMTKTYDNIGHFYSTANNYLPVSSYFQDPWKVPEKTEFRNHLYQSNIHNSWGDLHYSNQLTSSDSRKCIAFQNNDAFHKELNQIQKGSLRRRNLLLVDSYSSYDSGYFNGVDHSKAPLCYETAVEKLKSAVPSSTSLVLVPYKNRDSMCNTMIKYCNALVFNKKSLEICRTTIPQTRADLITSFNNISRVRRKMGNQLEALSYYQKSLNQGQTTMHPDRAYSTMLRKNIGNTMAKRGKHSRAFSFSDFTRDTLQCSSSSNS